MKQTVKQIGRYLLSRLKEPTTWASIVGLIAIYQPQIAHEVGLLAGALGVGLAEAGNQ